MSLQACVEEFLHLLFKIMKTLINLTMFGVGLNSVVHQSQFAAFMTHSTAMNSKH